MDHESGLQLSKPAVPTTPCFPQWLFTMVKTYTVVGLVQTTIMQAKLHQIDQSSLAGILHILFQPPTLPTVTASKAKTEKSDGRRAWSLQGSTNTPSKFLAWKAPQNRRQLCHQSNAAIRILSNSGGPESDSMIAPIRKRFLQTEATIAKVEIAEIETTSLRSKYAGKKAWTGPGGRKKLIKGKIGDWELLKQREMEEREKDESVVERAEAKAKKATGTRRGTGSTARASGTAQKAKVCLTQIFATF